LISFEEMKKSLELIVDKVWRFCEGSDVRVRTVTLKVKYADFQQITRSRSFPSLVNSREALEAASIELLRSVLPVSKGVRLLGVTLSALDAEEGGQSLQLALAL
jgi:DNA polymerase-4